MGDAPRLAVLHGPDPLARETRVRGQSRRHGHPRPVRDPRVDLRGGHARDRAGGGGGLWLQRGLGLLTWAVLDMGLRLDQIASDLVKRWYIIIGLAGFLMLVPLAVTSNNLSIRRLGPKAWQRLHRLTYAAILAGAVVLYSVMLATFHFFIN